MGNQFHTDQILRNIEATKKTLPPLLANQAKNFFVASFKKQGWDDQGVNAWKEVKRRVPGTSAYKYPKKKQLSRRTSPILVRTGKLRRAVSGSIRTQTFEKVQLVVPLVYAAVHNEGDENHKRRRFMGDSAALRRKQINLIEKEFNKVWQV